MLHSPHSYTSTCLPHIRLHTAPHPPHEDSHEHCYISRSAPHRNHPNIETCKVKVNTRHNPRLISKFKFIDKFKEVESGDEIDIRQKA